MQLLYVVLLTKMNKIHWQLACFHILNGLVQLHLRRYATLGSLIPAFNFSKPASMIYIRRKYCSKKYLNEQCF